MAKHFQTWETYWLYGGSGGPASGFDMYGHIEVYIDSQSQTNNTTSLYINHYVYAQVKGTNLGVITNATSKYRANKGSYGGTYKSVTKEISVEAGVGEKRYYLGQTWHTITHNEDGTAKLYINGNVAEGGKSTTSSFSKDLPKIERMSVLTATRANVGEVSQITVTKRNTAYVHSIKYQFGELTGYILADGTTTSEETKISETNIGFIIPESFYEQIPNAKEGVCTLTITTYNGETKIGSAQTTTFYVDVADKEENYPNLEVSVVDINEKTKTLTDVDTKLIKGYSTASISYKASGKNSATIANVTLNGEIVQENPILLDNFNKNSIELIATDSRGFSTPKTPEYEPINYFVPTISISARRTAPTENKILLSFSGNIFNQSFGSVMNELSLSWVYRIRGDEDWIDGGIFNKDVDYVIADNTYQSRKVNENGIETNEISLGEIFSYEKTYEIGVKYGDKLFDPIITSTIVSKGIPILNWNDKMVNVNGDLYVNGEPFSGGGDTLPIGAIVNYDGDTVPEGYEIFAEATYSTEEQKTSQTWLNGKPLYRKTFEFSITSTSSQTLLDVTNSGYDFVYIEEAIGVNKNNIFFGNYYYTSTDFSNVYFRMSNGSPTLMIYRGGSSYPVVPATLYVTLKYTKATD